ncbi:diacylglycerol/lipid kinase family protein [Dyadobacter psychrotolerans]|uniref:Diacylglycerol kinase n=1 Tax=Dyadobacter psychrotolerans TaxID=2541721 RepID=A0A4R5DTS0_9BACT|nr:diacylglycerol kinase family protein [Dyadobacter psychrotolerans]TDE15491.1 diacylglycerol kinase [Dyadobacter psychrotolerans]
MKKATLLHNPTAGEKDFSKSELTSVIEDEGFECNYASVKKDGWDEFSNETDFLIIAGGDGTVRRIAKALMKRRRLDKQYPIAILPHGTANNIAGTLNISGKVKDIVKTWHSGVLKKFDIGKIYGLEEEMFFLEGFGCGIFPRLIKVMEKMDDEIGDSVDEKIKAARAVLYDIVLNYKALNCKIIADGVEHSGKYIMVEIMNTRSIGPNLELVHSADPGDGELEIVLIPESHQKKFEDFLLDRINGGDEEYNFTIIKAKNIELEWEGKDIHVDDERLKPEKPAKITIQVQPGMLEFMVAGE